MPIVDTCSGTACKFLQAPVRSGGSGHERPRPDGLVARVKIAGPQLTEFGIVGQSPSLPPHPERDDKKIGVHTRMELYASTGHGDSFRIVGELHTRSRLVI